MVKRVLGLILLAASCAWAQGPAAPVTGQINAATTNATCANNGVQNGGAVDQPINGFTGAVGISVTGTWAATLNIQTTVDHGKTWTASGGTFTANQQSVISSVGNTDVCVFASAYTSGTAIVTFATSAVPPAGISGTGASASQTQGTAANGSAPVGNPVLIAGQDATPNTRIIRTNANGGVATQSTSIAVTDGMGGGIPIGDNGNNVGPMAVDSMVFNGATWDRGIYCNKTTFQSAITANTVQIVAGVASQKIHVCSVIIERNDVTGVATTLKFVEGTGTNCGTGQASLTGNLFSSGTTAVTTDSPPVNLALGSTGSFITLTAADALCVQTTGAASSFDVTITFVQY